MINVSSYSLRDYHTVITVWNYINEVEIFVKSVGAKDVPKTVNENYVGCWRIKTLTHP